MRKLAMAVLILLIGFCRLAAASTAKVVYVKHFNKQSGPFTDWIKDELWIANVDGTGSKMLCLGKPSFSLPVYPVSKIQSPVFSNDNKRVYFQNYFNSREVYLWQVGVDGRDLKMVAPYHFFDGQTLKTISRQSPNYPIVQIMANKDKETKKVLTDGRWVVEESYTSQGRPCYFLTRTDGSRSWPVPIGSLQDINFSCPQGVLMSEKKPDLNSFKGEIEKAVKQYCQTHTSPGWSEPPDRVLFNSKKIMGDWATITGNVVDARGKVAGEGHIGYLLKKTVKGWQVVWWSDEHNISPQIAKKRNIPLKVIRELGWSTYDDG